MSAPVDVLAVLETQAALVDWMTKEEIAGNPLRSVRAAVAELIEAAAEYAHGEYHDSDVESNSEYRSRRRKERYRVEAAIARVKGGDA